MGTVGKNKSDDGATEGREAETRAELQEDHQ